MATKNTAIREAQKQSEDPVCGRQRTQSADAQRTNPEGNPGDRPQPPDGNEAIDYQDLFRQLVSRANSGERVAIDLLRKFLDQNPSIWARVGDLNAMAESAWMQQIAGDDRLTTEAVKRMLEALKSELRGKHATRLEALLVDLIGVSWLGMQHAEIQAASAGGSLNQATYRLKRAESTQKRLLAATKTLATLRSLMPKGLAPLNSFRVFDPETKLA